MAGTTGTADKTGTSQPGAGEGDNVADVANVGDDGGETQIATSESTSEAEPTERARPEVESESLDRRSAIAKRYREKRAEEAAEEAAAKANGGKDGAETVSASDSGDNSETGADQDTAAATSKNDAANAVSGQQPTKRKLKVDGVEHEKTDAEVLELAQKYLAGNNRLESSKEVLKAVRELSDKITTQITANQRAPGASAVSDTANPGTAVDPSSLIAGADQSAIDAATLAELVERVNEMQTGDAEAGAKALAAVLAKSQAQIESKIRAEQAGQIRSVAAADRIEGEISGAISQFKQNYPEIASDSLAYAAAGTAVREEIIKDLKAEGATDEDLKQHDTGLLARAHQKLRTSGHKVRTYDQVLEDVAKRVGGMMKIEFKGKSAADTTATTQNKGNGVRAELGKDNPAKPNGTGAPQRIVVNPEEASRRVDLKRQVQQPKTAGGRVPTQGQQQRPKTVRDVIADMRQSRKVYPVNR